MSKETFEDAKNATPGGGDNPPAAETSGTLAAAQHFAFTDTGPKIHPAAQHFAFMNAKPKIGEGGDQEKFDRWNKSPYDASVFMKPLTVEELEQSPAFKKAAEVLQGYYGEAKRLFGIPSLLGIKYNYTATEGALNFARFENTGMGGVYRWFTKDRVEPDDVKLAKEFVRQSYEHSKISGAGIAYGVAAMGVEMVATHGVGTAAELASGGFKLLQAVPRVAPLIAPITNAFGEGAAVTARISASLGSTFSPVFNSMRTGLTSAAARTGLTGAFNAVASSVTTRFAAQFPTLSKLVGIGVKAGTESGIEAAVENAPRTVVEQAMLQDATNRGVTFEGRTYREQQDFSVTRLAGATAFNSAFSAVLSGAPSGVWKTATSEEARALYTAAGNQYGAARLTVQHGMQSLKDGIAERANLALSQFVDFSNNAFDHTIGRVYNAATNALDNVMPPPGSGLHPQLALATAGVADSPAARRFAQQEDDVIPENSFAFARSKKSSGTTTTPATTPAPRNSTDDIAWKPSPWGGGPSASPVTPVRMLEKAYDVPLLGWFARRIDDTGTLIKLTPEYLRMGRSPWHSYNNWTKDWFDTVDTFKTNNFSNLFIGLFPKHAVEVIPEGTTTKLGNHVFKHAAQFADGTSNPRYGQAVYNIERSIGELGDIISDTQKSGRKEAEVFVETLEQSLSQNGKLAAVEQNLLNIQAMSEIRDAYEKAADALKTAIQKSNTVSDARAQLNAIISGTKDASTKDLLAEAAKRLQIYEESVETAAQKAKPSTLLDLNANPVRNGTTAYVPSAPEQLAFATNVMSQLEIDLRAQNARLSKAAEEARAEAVTTLKVLQTKLNETGKQAVESSQKPAEAIDALKKDLEYYNIRKADILNDPFGSNQAGSWTRKNGMTGGSIPARLAVHEILPHMEVVENFGNNLSKSIGDTGTQIAEATQKIDVDISNQLTNIENVSVAQLLDRIRTVKTTLSDNAHSVRTTTLGMSTDFSMQHANATAALREIERIGQSYTETRGNVGGGLFSSGLWSGKWQIRQTTGRVELDVTEAHKQMYMKLVASGEITPPESFNKPGGLTLDYKSGDTPFSYHKFDDGGKGREQHTIEFAYNAASAEAKTEAEIKAKATSIIVENSRDMLNQGKWNDMIESWKWLGLTYNTGPGERTRGITEEVITAITAQASQAKMAAGSVQNPWTPEVTAATASLKRMQFDFGNNRFRDEWKPIASHCRMRRYGNYYTTEAKHESNPNEYRSAMAYKYWTQPFILGMWPVHEIPSRIVTKFAPVTKAMYYGGKLVKWLPGGAGIAERWEKKSTLGKIGTAAATIFTGGLNTKIGRYAAIGFLVAHLGEEGYELKTGNETNLDIGSRGLSAQLSGVSLLRYPVQAVWATGDALLGTNTSGARSVVTDDLWPGSNWLKMHFGPLTPLSDRFDSEIFNTPSSPDDKNTPAPEEKDGDSTNDSIPDNDHIAPGTTDIIISMTPSAADGKAAGSPGYLTKTFASGTMAASGNGNPDENTITAGDKKSEFRDNAVTAQLASNGDSRPGSASGKGFNPGPDFV